MGIDLVCGMEVRENTGLKALFQDKLYYFCSESCKKTFEKNPTKFIK